MVYKIIDIQGVGPVYAEKLTAAGIDTVDQLLEAVDCLLLFALEKQPRDARNLKRRPESPAS